jgi:hypothetical protein
LAIDEHDRVVDAALIDGVAGVGDVAAVILGELDEGRGQLAEGRLGDFLQRRATAGEEEQLGQADDVGLLLGGGRHTGEHLFGDAGGRRGGDALLGDRGDPDFAREAAFTRGALVGRGGRCG